MHRYIATIENAKHRFFTFVPIAIVPDSTLVTFASEDAYWLGVLSSTIHVNWALAAGGSLGVGNDPVYDNSKCFDAFPFAAATPDQQARIRDLAEQLDVHRKRQQPRIRGLAEQLGAHRKRQQAQHPELTLTGMYNVLEKLKAGEPLSAKERDIHQKGLVSVLKTLHDEIDRAVLDAYGWSDLAPLMEIVNGNVVGRSGLQAAMNDDGIEDVGNRAVDGAPTGTVAPPGRSGLQAAMCSDTIDDVRDRAVDGAPTGIGGAAW